MAVPRLIGFATLAAVLVFPALALAQDSPPTAQDAIDKISETSVILNTVWTLIAAMLVFWMNAGFACLETGLCRRKNAVNILAKNFVVFAISSIAFWVIGFGLMFGSPEADSAANNNWIGTTGFLSSLAESEAGKFTALSWTNVPLTVKFFFQLVFAGTAATIVSGAVAERIKFGSFMLFSFLLVAIVYPITGHWAWGGGWLQDKLYHDFAGSSVVHMCGGIAALTGVLILGPRIGKYRPDGSVNPIPGHNMGLAALGCLILWLGWFGFNPGSTMTADKVIGHIAVTTNTAAAFGAIAATITAWLVLGKPDLSMILNGCLAGLVAVTAPCAVVTVMGSAIIGIVGGIIVVLAVLFFDKVRLDDPVGALSVHLVNGIWGIIAVGLFANPEIMTQWVNSTGEYCKPGLFYGGGFDQLGVQLLGIASFLVFVGVLSTVFWVLLKATVGIRVSPAEEYEGLDIGEHGMEAYSGFAEEQVSGTASGGAFASSSSSPMPTAAPATAR